MNPTFTAGLPPGIDGGGVNLLSGVCGGRGYGYGCGCRVFLPGGCDSEEGGAMNFNLIRRRLFWVGIGIMCFFIGALKHLLIVTGVIR